MNNWQTKKLGEVCKYTKGKKPKILVKEKQDTCNIPYINIKAFEKHIFDEYTDGIKCNLCEDGDLLMVWDGARAGFSGKARKGAVGSTLMKIEPIIDVVEKDYIFYFLQSIYRKLNTNPRGVGIPHVEPTLLWNAELIIPDLPTQQAIVSKIEELFSELDQGIAELKKAQEQLKTYRQSVLKQAFDKELIANSKKEKLKNITSKIGSGSTPKGGEENYKENGIPLIRSLNIHFDYIKFEKLAFIDEKQAEKLKNVIVQEGDVLLNITGASIGRVNIAPKEFNNGRVNQHVSIIRPKADIFITKFLKLYLQSSKIQNWIANVNVGATRQGLTKSALENLEIPVPSLPEQHQIVQEIESRLSVADKMAETINESLQKAEALRQSVLKQAFSGELVVQISQTPSN